MIDKLLRTVYLVYGDGSFRDRIILTSINYRNLIEFIRVMEEDFGFPKEIAKFRMMVNDKAPRIQIEKMKRYWKRRLQIKKIDSVYKTSFNTCRQGCMRVVYHRAEAARLFQKIIASVNHKIFGKKMNQVKIGSVLDGILNAEGGAGREKKGLHKITVAYNRFNLEEKRLFESCLNALELDYRDSQDRRFEISRWINHYKFLLFFVSIEIMPFSLYPARAFNLVDGFLSHQRTKSVYAYMLAISKKEGQTLREINRHMNYDISSIEEALLRKFRPFGFFHIEGGGINRNPYKVFLTERGKSFLKVLKRVIEWHRQILKEHKKDTELIRTLHDEQSVTIRENRRKEGHCQKRGIGRPYARMRALQKES